jgi:hypothetical protein
MILRYDCLECDDPPHVAHALTPSRDLAVNSTITYQCVDGYMADGSDVITCGNDGNWTQLQLTCKGTQ